MYFLKKSKTLHNKLGTIQERKDRQGTQDFQPEETKKQAMFKDMKMVRFGCSANAVTWCGTPTSRSATASSPRAR
jgi:hypothetical protein